VIRLDANNSRGKVSDASGITWSPRELWFHREHLGDSPPDGAVSYYNSLTFKISKVGDLWVCAVRESGKARWLMPVRRRVSDSLWCLSLAHHSFTFVLFSAVSQMTAVIVTSSMYQLTDWCIGHQTTNIYITVSWLFYRVPSESSEWNQPTWWSVRVTSEFIGQLHSSIWLSSLSLNCDISHYMLHFIIVKMKLADGIMYKQVLDSIGL